MLFTNTTVKLSFITVYMPCDTGLCDVNRAAEDFYDVLTEISRIAHVHEEYETLIGGDVNTAYKRNNALSTLLRNFCEDESLVDANMQKKANIDCTYCKYASGATSIIYQIASGMLAIKKLFCFKNVFAQEHSLLNKNINCIKTS